MSRSMHVAANGIISFILMDSSGFKVTLVWLPNFCFKNLLRIYIHEWQHATQSLETDLIHAKPWAINRLVSSLVTGEFLAVENLGNSCVTKASVQTSEHSWWWSAWPPFPRAILLCRGARESRCQPACCFQKDVLTLAHISQGRVSHDHHIQTSLQTPHLSPWHQL